MTNLIKSGDFVNIDRILCRDGIKFSEKLTEIQNFFTFVNRTRSKQRPVLTKSKKRQKVTKMEENLTF